MVEHLGHPLTHGQLVPLGLVHARRREDPGSSFDSVKNAPWGHACIHSDCQCLRWNGRVCSERTSSRLYLGYSLPEAVSLHPPALISSGPARHAYQSWGKTRYTVLGRSHWQPDRWGRHVPLGPIGVPRACRVFTDVHWKSARDVYQIPRCWVEIPHLRDSSQSWPGDRLPRNLVYVSGCI